MAERAIRPESHLRNQAARAELRRRVDLLIALSSTTVKRESIGLLSFNIGKDVWDYNVRLRNNGKSTEQHCKIQMKHDGPP